MPDLNDAMSFMRMLESQEQFQVSLEQRMLDRMLTQKRWEFEQSQEERRWQEQFQVSLEQRMLDRMLTQKRWEFEQSQEERKWQYEQLKEIEQQQYGQVKENLYKHLDLINNATTANEKRMYIATGRDYLAGQDSKMQQHFSKLLIHSPLGPIEQKAENFDKNFPPIPDASPDANELTQLQTEFQKLRRTEQRAAFMGAPMERTPIISNGEFVGIQDEKGMLTVLPMEAYMASRFGELLGVDPAKVLTDGGNITTPTGNLLIGTDSYTVNSSYNLYTKKRSVKIEADPATLSAMRERDKRFSELVLDAYDEKKPLGKVLKQATDNDLTTEQAQYFLDQTFPGVGLKISPIKPGAFGGFLGDPVIELPGVYFYRAPGTRAIFNTTDQMSYDFQVMPNGSAYDDNGRFIGNAAEVEMLIEGNDNATVLQIFTKMNEAQAQLTGEPAPLPAQQETTPAQVEPAPAESPAVPRAPEKEEASPLEQYEASLPLKIPTAQGLYRETQEWEMTPSVWQRGAKFMGKTQIGQGKRFGEGPIETALRLATGESDLHSLRRVALKLRHIYGQYLDDIEIARIVRTGELPAPPKTTKAAGASK